MSTLLGIGSGYGISAGLVLYADTNGLIDADLRLTIILGWALAGLALAFVSAAMQRVAK